MPALEESRARATSFAGTYGWYVLGVLFLVYVVNFVDRQILSILAQDIKMGLGISDAQIGFLYGTAFAIFYSLFGIPLGRLADGWYRGRLIALGLALWSGMTALSGFASSFGQLAVARVGIGIGEASASPAAYSMLGDYFPKARRALALSIYSSGVYVGGALSLPIGGTIAHSWTRHFASGGAPFGLAGWQAAFLAVGIPGVLLAAWVLTLREPPRASSNGPPTPAQHAGAWRDFGREVASIVPPFTLWSSARFPGGLRANVLLLGVIALAAGLLTAVTGDVLQWGTLGVGVYAVASWIQQLRANDRPSFIMLWGTPAVVLALLLCGFLALINYGVFFWVPPYAIRTFHIDADVAGWMIGVPQGFASAAGCILGGRLSDAWRKRDLRGRVFVCGLTMVLAPPLTYATVSSHDVFTFYLLYPVAAMTLSMWLGSAVAMIQDSVLPRMRATAGATTLLSFSLVGLALGPYFAGRVSVLTGSLRLGILSVFIVTPVALYVLWHVSRTLPRAEATKAARALAAGELTSPGIEA